MVKLVGLTESVKTYTYNRSHGSAGDSMTGAGCNLTEVLSGPAA